ncbi:unnamed protein product [Paramecium octaurelia]|uniref:FHA domain-containing protein n=1 Tax=Paramecium octaurelia TaxID=43137 RepID=A0A8S1T386_PAROT|nr:unnamed protein product [Paramecium octaurelia]
MDYQTKLRVSIDILSCINQEKQQKVVIANIINKCRLVFDIDSGLVLKQSTITNLNKDILQEINYTFQQDEILSLIYPLIINNHPIQMVVNLQNDGIYERVKQQKELLRGEEYYVGLPSGQNQQFIQIQQGEIIINNQSFMIKENMNIVFVKKKSKQDSIFEQIQMINPTMCSSHQHAHIKVQNGRIFLVDGFQENTSKNGVWILVKHQMFSNHNQYCYKDFRLAIYLN